MTSRFSKVFRRKEVISNILFVLTYAVGMQSKIFWLPLYIFYMTAISLMWRYTKRCPLAVLVRSSSISSFIRLYRFAYKGKMWKANLVYGGCAFVLLCAIIDVIHDKL